MNKTGFFTVFYGVRADPSAPLAQCRQFCGHSKIWVAIVICTFSAVIEQLTSKVRNLLFSKFFPFFPKKNENSKFRTLLVSCSITAENVQITIATRILLCPPISAQKFRGALGGALRECAKKTVKN
jgi:hypothetical protein